MKLRSCLLIGLMLSASGTGHCEGVLRTASLWTGIASGMTSFVFFAQAVADRAESRATYRNANKWEDRNRWTLGYFYTTEPWITAERAEAERLAKRARREAWTAAGLAVSSIVLINWGVSVRPTEGGAVITKEIRFD